MNIPSIPLAEVQLSATHILAASTGLTSSPSTSPPPSSSNPSNQHVTAWVRNANLSMDIIERDVQAALCSLDFTTIPDSRALGDLLWSANQCLERAQALRSIRIPAVQERKKSIQAQIDDLVTRIKVLQRNLPQDDTLASGPVPIDLPSLKSTNLTKMTTITQLMVLFGVTCSAIMGLGTEACEFIIGVGIALVKAAMSTSSTIAYTPTQNLILEEMPTSLYSATSKMDLDGQYTTYAACPSCNFTHKAFFNAARKRPEYPPTCLNHVPGETGLIPCNAKLLKGSDLDSPPLKPFVVRSFREYLAELLSNADVERMCDDACDDTLRWQSDPSHFSSNEVFKGDFFREFKDPSGQCLFIDRGRGKARLAFIMHVDFFNPHRSTVRGSHDSIGSIYLSCLNLPKSLRDKPEFVFLAGIIPGPHEPPLDEISHYIKPVIDEFYVGWKRGFHLVTSSSPNVGRDAEVAIVIATNDLPGARKVSGMAGVNSHFYCTVCTGRDRHNIYNVDFDQWQRRNVDELRSHAEAWRDAQTLGDRSRILNNHGVRWSELWRLPYWDPTRMLVIDSMHCLLEGLVHYHCRRVLELSSSKSSPPRQPVHQHAFSYPWPKYDPASLHNDYHVRNVREERQISNIQSVLMHNLTVPHSESLSQLKHTLLAYNKSPLKFVWHSLGLPNQVLRINQDGSTTAIPATTKEHFARLLINWVNFLTRLRATELLLIF
jgi:hypothetical protein